jgi:hypothetical protein
MISSPPPLPIHFGTQQAQAWVCSMRTIALLKGCPMTRLPVKKPARHHQPPTDGSGVLPGQSLQHHTIKRHIRYAVVLFAWRCVIKLASLSYSTRYPTMLDNELCRPPPSLTFMIAVSARLRLCVPSYALFYGMPAQKRTAQDGPNSYVPGGALHAPALRVGADRTRQVHP